MAWSALGVLMIAAVLVVQRVADLSGESVPPQPPPVAIAAAPERPASTPALVDATSAPAPVVATAEPAPDLSGPRETIAAARQAAKPSARSRPQATRKPPPRDVARSGAIEAAPMPAPARPATVLVAQAYPERASRTRWEAMHDEIATCPSADFVDGVMCQQRVRIRYCTGWWGQSRDCPSRRDDYGN